MENQPKSFQMNYMEPFFQQEFCYKYTVWDALGMNLQDEPVNIIHKSWNLDFFRTKSIISISCMGWFNAGSKPGVVRKSSGTLGNRNRDIFHARN